MSVPSNIAVRQYPKPPLSPTKVDVFQESIEAYMPDSPTSTMGSICVEVISSPEKVPRSIPIRTKGVASTDFRPIRPSDEWTRPRAESETSLTFSVDSEVSSVPERCCDPVASFTDADGLLGLAFCDYGGMDEWGSTGMVE